MTDRGKSKEQRQDEGKTRKWPAFMCIGISLGAGLGILFGNITIGSGLGLCFGLLAGMILDNKGEND